MFSGMSWCAVVSVVPNILKDCSAFIFRVKQLHMKSHTVSLLLVNNKFPWTSLWIQRRPHSSTLNLQKQEIN